MIAHIMHTTSIANYTLQGKLEIAKDRNPCFRTKFCNEWLLNHKTITQFTFQISFNDFISFEVKTFDFKEIKFQVLNINIMYLFY